MTEVQTLDKCLEWLRGRHEHLSGEIQMVEGGLDYAQSSCSQQQHIGYWENLLEEKKADLRECYRLIEMYNAEACCLEGGQA